jgi:hypothetical protein
MSKREVKLSVVQHAIDDILERIMTYFKHTEEHGLDCDCSYCLDVDPNKSIARELERVTEVIVSATINKLEPSEYRIVGEAIVRLNFGADPVL